MLEGAPKDTGGRPSLYKPEYDGIVEALGKQGKSKAQMCSILNIGRRTFFDWERQYPEFAAAVARAMEHAQGWWEAKAQNSLGKKTFQAQLWRYSMAGRFKEDYAEKPAGADVAGAFVDFLGAIGEIAEAAKTAKRRPGDGAKVIGTAAAEEDDASRDRKG